MGTPMVRRLAAAGFDVHVHDIDPAAIRYFDETPTVCPTDDAVEAARAVDVLVLMLPDSAAVETVVRTAGLLDALGAGSVLVDMGSSEPACTQRLASELAHRDIAVVDAPVSGGVAGAEQGTLTVMVGGDPEPVARCHPTFDVLGTTVMHVGPSGAGHAVKALNNLLSATSMLATAEAVLIADRFGVDPGTVIDVVNSSSGRSWSSQYKFPRFVLPQEFRSGFSAALLRKDVDTALALAAHLGVDAPVARGVCARWQSLSERLAIDADHTAIGVPLEAAAETNTAVWHDLSRPLYSGMPRVHTFPEPVYRQLLHMPEHPLNATEINMVAHVGTHVDAPCHFIPDAPAIDELPLERFRGPGVVWRLNVAPGGLIDVDDLEDARPSLRPGDILILDTGTAEHFGTDRYDDHPSLAVAAAHWIIDHQVKLLAVDTPTPDVAVARRAADFDWPVHHALLAAGVLISEHVCNLRPLAGQRVEANFVPLNITGADGAPVRALARPY
jgi:3-hydroxyisobutyrate dehydrogenase